MRKLMERTLSLLLAAALLVLPAYAAPSVSAQSAILIDADSGAVLFERNADARALIASTTKIMTAVVVLEHCDPAQQFTIPATATGIEGSSMYLKEGEVLSIRDLLYGLMLHSGNDAAIALALACCDSVPEFVDLMNLKAQQLSLRNTHFDNPNGLDSDTHYSSAADLASLTQYALKNDTFRQIVSTKTVMAGGRSLTNHNRLLWSLEGAIGVKTGYTRAAGRILVSAAERNGRRLIAVTINDGNDWKDHTALYDFGFSAYTEQTVIQRGDIVAHIPLMQGGQAPLTAAEEVRYALSAQESVRVELLYPRVAFAPEPRGTLAGFGALYVGNKRIATIRLQWGVGEREDEGTVTEDPLRAWGSLPPCGGTIDFAGARFGERSTGSARLYGGCRA